jgi:3-oxoacyl-[acyl-carrier protein] reductase
MSEERKVALITGASRGIGKACAIELAKAGYEIIINYAGNEEAANQTVNEIEAIGVSAKAVKFDVSNKTEVETALSAIITDYGRIDVLVNNAGITRDGLFIRMSSDAWEAVINTNLNSAFYVTNPISKIMIKQRTGCIINMASIAGVYGNAGQTNYAAAKAGLIGFTKALAKELASRGIRVNAIAPGFIQTDMTKDLNTEKIIEAIPLKTLGKAEDIA